MCFWHGISLSSAGSSPKLDNDFLIAIRGYDEIAVQNPFAVHKVTLGGERNIIFGIPFIGVNEIPGLVEFNFDSHAPL
jgi:hypothetical protein